MDAIGSLKVTTRAENLVQAGACDVAGIVARAQYPDYELGSLTVGTG